MNLVSGESIRFTGVLRSKPHYWGRMELLNKPVNLMCKYKYKYVNSTDWLLSGDENMA